jgi:uncharacterized protein YndB with AHSA1/START domain
MLSHAEHGCLVLADITGYTGYLAGSELEHAQDVLADLMETVLKALKPTLRLAKLEGDAAFVFAPTGKIDASMLLDTVEECYFTFRRRLQSIRQATTCACNACVLIPGLNLKFFAHDGEFVRQRIAGREELAGTDVILVHRLMKNTVATRLRLQGYALFTAPCVAAMNVDPATLAMREHRETYEHIGEVLAYVHDLEARWKDERARRRVIVEAKDAEIVFEAPLPAPPPVVWEYMTDPAKRMQWQVGTDRLDQSNPKGRRGAGTTNHCVHGHGTVVEEILDWRPFEYYTIRAAVPGLGMTTYTVQLAENDSGTSMQFRVEKIRRREQRELWLGGVRDQWMGGMRVWTQRLSELLTEEMATRDPGPSPLPSDRAPAPPHAH